MYFRKKWLYGSRPEFPVLMKIFTYIVLYGYTVQMLYFRGYIVIGLEFKNINEDSGQSTWISLNNFLNEYEIAHRESLTPIQKSIKLHVN